MCGVWVSIGVQATYSNEEVVNEFRSIGAKVIKVLVNVVKSQDGIASHIRVSVLKVGADGRKQRFQNFGLLQFAQETQGRTTNVFVGVNQVITQSVTV